MAPRKHPGRCGCENSWTFPDANENPSCCEHALSAPCWYALSFECPAYWATPYVDGNSNFVREPLLGNPLGLLAGRGECHFLAKDCITGCTWGDRWTTSAFGYETPLVTVVDCPTQTICADVTTPPDSTGLDDTTSDFFDGESPEFSPCGIECNGSSVDCVPCAWANFCNGAEFTETGLQRCINNVVGDALLRKKWELLMISTTEATLTCTSNQGWVAQYYCSDFNPVNKSTFVRSNCHAMLIGLPVRICCIPISKSVANPCDTIGDKCRCNDPGFCSTTIWVQVSGCSGFSGRQIVGLSRMYSVGAGLTGVSMPSPAPCGFFWGTVGVSGTTCGNYRNQMGIQIWCDGTTYQIAVYCLKLDNTWEAVSGAAITSIISTCFGPELAFTIPEMPCCCLDVGEPVETGCCPDDPTPRTLTAEGVLSDCTECTGTASGSATYVEGEANPTWDVDITVCSRTYTIRLTCETVAGVTSWYANMTDTDPDCGLGLPYAGSFISSACNPLEIVFIWSISGCCGDIAESPLLTVTWTE